MSGLGGVQTCRRGSLMRRRTWSQMDASEKQNRSLLKWGRPNEYDDNPTQTAPYPIPNSNKILQFEWTINELVLGFGSQSLIAPCYMRVKGRAVCLVLLVAFFFPLLAFSSWIWLDCIAWASLGLQKLLEEECLVQLDLLATDGRHTFCCRWPGATPSPQWETYGSFTYKLRGN